MTSDRGRPADAGEAGQPTAVPENPRAERVVALSFGIAALAGIALVVVFAFDLNVQVQATLLFVGLAALGAGIVIWSRDLLPDQLYEEPRHAMAHSPDSAALLADTVVAQHALTRRRLLVRALGAAVAALGAALAVPIFALGPAPGGSLTSTPWRKGLRLVDVDDKPITASSIPIDGVVTVFPEGSPGSADGQALLIHVEADLLRLPSDRLAVAPQGFVCYSKVCTHAGCPVGLYRASLHSLICPCHQSTFQVLEGATPVFGPAVRPLPQLPIQLQPDGTFVALGDFTGTVGPSFWDMAR